MCAAERDLPVVGRPHRTPDRVDGRQIDSPLHRGAGDVHQVEHVLAFPVGRKRQQSSVVGEGALRIEKPQLLEIRVGGAFDQTLYSFAGAGVSEPEIDEQLAALLVSIGEESDAISVLGEGGRQKDLASALLLSEQRLREGARPVQHCRLG